MKNLLLILLLLLVQFCGFSQDNTASAEDQVCNHLLGKYTHSVETSKKRGVLKTKDSNFWGKVNPFKYLASGALFVYQNVFSEQISASCTYEISCSEMTKQSIAHYGLIKGTFIGLHQLTNCSPSILHDHEKHVISEDKKIRNSVSDE